MKPGASMPYLVQVLLPVYDNDGGRFPVDHHDEVRMKLTDLFRRVDRVHSCTSRRSLEYWRQGEAR